MDKIHEANDLKWIHLEQNRVELRTFTKLKVLVVITNCVKT